MTTPGWFVGTVVLADTPARLLATVGGGVLGVTIQLNAKAFLLLLQGTVALHHWR